MADRRILILDELSWRRLTAYVPADQREEYFRAIEMHCESLLVGHDQLECREHWQEKERMERIERWLERECRYLAIRKFFDRFRLVLLNLGRLKEFIFPQL